MNKNKTIYKLTIEDILNVMEENDIDIKLTNKNVRFIEDKVGDMIDWRGAIEFALSELNNVEK
jgi:hypothetical protein